MRSILSLQEILWKTSLSSSSSDPVAALLNGAAEEVQSLAASYDEDGDLGEEDQKDTLEAVPDDDDNDDDDELGLDVKFEEEDEVDSAETTDKVKHK